MGSFVDMRGTLGEGPRPGPLRGVRGVRRAALRALDHADMKRAVVLLAVSAVAGLLATSACDGGGGGHHHGRHGRGPHGACHAQTTCGTCTPVLGCGWCFTGPSTGFCVDGPDDCPSDTVGWTWDPPGCDADGGEAGAPLDGGRIPAEASVGDGASDTDASDTQDASQD